MIYRSDAGDIHYEVHGPADAPTVVFIHGAGLDSQMFDAQVAALREAFQVVIWDMPGHGRSARLSRALPFEQMAHHLIGILDQVGAAKAVLVGQSLGSWVGQHAAILFPERVAAIVSIGGTPLQQGTGRLEWLVYRLSLALSRLIPGRPLFRWTARMKATTPEAQRYAEASMVRIGKEQFLRIVAGMLEAGRLQITTVPKQPLLIVHGAEEWPKSVAKRCAAWHAASPGSTYPRSPAPGTTPIRTVRTPSTRS